MRTVTTTRCHDSRVWKYHRCDRCVHYEPHLFDGGTCHHPELEYDFPVPAFAACECFWARDLRINRLLEPTTEILHRGRYRELGQIPPHQLKAP